MQKIAFAFLLCICLHQNTVTAQDAFDTQMKVYSLSLRYYDLNAASSALYHAMVLKPERKDLKDSLASIYFAGDRFLQANLLGEELLKENPKRMDMLEMVAVCKQSLGMPKESLADYEILHKETKNVIHLYQIATLQYQLKRIGECTTSLDQIIADPAAAKQMVSIRNPNQPTQNVPVKAAAYNVKGIVALELNQSDNAKLAFAQALEIAPDFTLAKSNMTMMDRNKANAAPANLPVPRSNLGKK
jgi:tetratricopeptide (TPR) repeat protein